MGGHMAPEEFRRIKQDFRSKSTQYKRMKAELNELRAERGVIQLTVTILEGRCADMDGFVAEQEKKAGVVGFTKDQAALEKAAASKAESDHRKGLTLQEHSEIVEKTRLEINEKK